MIKLDRYLGRTLATHILVALGGLVLLIAAFSFIEQQDDVGQGDYTVALAMLHTLLLVPSWLANFAAIAVLLGTLTGFGQLQQDSEITAMRAAGYPVSRLVAVAMIVATIVAGSTVAIGERIAPGFVQLAARVKTESRFGTSVSTSRDAWWTRDGQRILHVDRDERGAGRTTVFELGPQGILRSISTAGSSREGDADSILLEGFRSTIYEDERTRIRVSAQQAIRSAPLRAILRLSETGKRPAFDSLPSLAARARVLAIAGLDARVARFEVNSRVAQFVVAPLLAAIAILGSLGGLRAARQGARLVIGLLVGLTLSMLRDIAQSAVLVFGWPAASAAWLPVAASLAVLLLMRWQQAKLRA